MAETNPKYLPALYDVLDFLSQVRSGDEDKVWSRVVDKLAVAMDAEAASYFVFLPKLKQLIARYALGPSAQQLSSTPIDLGQGILGWVAQRQEPLLVEDAYKDSRFSDGVDQVTGFKTRNIMALPLNDPLELSGVIELLNKRSGPFVPEDLRLAEAACRATVMTLRVLRLQIAMEKVTAHNASILENLGGGFIAVDLRGRLMLMNPAARKILSISADLPLNIPVEQALMNIPQMAEVLVSALSSRQTVKRQDLPWVFEGRKKTIGYSTLLIQDPQGAVAGVGITFQDITNLK